MQDSSETFQMLHNGMLNAGIDVQEVYGRLLKAGQMPALEGRFPHSVHVAFWQTLESVTNDPEIALHLCPHLPIYRGRVFEYIFLSSANYEQGLHSAFKYQSLVSDAFNVRLVNDNSGVRIVMRGAAGDEPELRHTEICFVYSFLSAMAKVTDDNFKPTHIVLRARPVAPREEFEALFECPVEFTSGDSEIWLLPGILKHKSPHRDPELLQLHRKYGDNQVAQIARKNLLVDVRQHIKQQFEAGTYRNRKPPSVSEIAKTIGVSSRHLRFVLSEGGTNFRQLLNEARFVLASRLLKSTDKPVHEVALEVGFSEPGTFRRAFKKWSGMTPTDYRQSSH